MSYYNILFRYGIARFASVLAKGGVRGAIVPDLPPEEGQEYLRAMEEHHLAPVPIFSPTTSFERMKYLAGHGRGFVYCVARRGVTGAKTDFTQELTSYLSRCRKATSLPLALGFGVEKRADIDFLKGKADIAVIGTRAIGIVEHEGIHALGDFLEGLR